MLSTWDVIEKRRTKQPTIRGGALQDWSGRSLFGETIYPYILYLPLLLEFPEQSVIWMYRDATIEPNLAKCPLFSVMSSALVKFHTFQA